MSGESILFKVRQLSLSLYRALPGLGLWLAATSVALALISPPMFLQRNRAAMALNESQRTQANEVAQKCAITATPEEFQKLLAESSPQLSRALAFQYYSAVAHVEERERVVEAYTLRRKNTELALDALHDYIRRCHARLRQDDHADEFSVTVWPADPEPNQKGFSFQKKPEGLRVYHMLPWPEHLQRDLALKAELLAEEDLQRCQKDDSTIENARDTYASLNLTWLRWLNQMAVQIERRSEAALRAEVVQTQAP